MTVGVDATDLFESYMPADARQYRYNVLTCTGRNSWYFEDLKHLVWCKVIYSEGNPFSRDYM